MDEEKRRVLDSMKRHRATIGMQFDSSGYVERLEDNLVQMFPNWIDVRTRIGNLQKYVNRTKEIKGLPDGFAKEILGHYIDCDKTLHLDVSFWEMYDGDPVYDDCIARLRERYEMEVR